MTITKPVTVKKKSEQPVITSLKQPRVHKYAALVPEFRESCTLTCDTEQEMLAHEKTQQQLKLVEIRAGGDLEKGEKTAAQFSGVFGNFWTKTEFMEKDLSLQHTYRTARSNQDYSLRAIFNFDTN